MNAAILLAGGSGSRMGSPVPKQYMQLNGRIMLAWAAGSLMESSHTDCIYIVAEKEWRQKITDELEKAGQNIEKIRAFADPGKNRQLSIRNALEMIASDMGVGKMSDLSDEDTVFIHDAARPFLSSALIDRIYDSLDGHDGVMPALPVKDTVYQSSGDGRIESLLDRSRVYSGQAPELFVLGKYYRANMDLSMDEIMKINGSSEPAVMAGMDVLMIPGDEANFKVTTDEDMKKCRMIMEKGL